MKIIGRFLSLQFENHTITILLMVMYSGINFYGSFHYKIPVDEQVLVQNNILALSIYLFRIFFFASMLICCINHYLFLSG